MTLAGLHTERTWLRRYPMWLGAICLGVGYWLDRQDDSQRTPFFLTGIGIVVVGGLLTMRYHRHVRLRAPELIAHVLATPVTTPLRVRRSAAAVGGALLQIGIAVALAVGVSRGLVHLILGAEGSAQVSVSAVLGLIAAAFLLWLLALAVISARRLLRTLAGHPVLEIDADGISIDDLGLRLLWTEIDGVYCMNPTRSVSGIALHLADATTTMARSTRWLLLHRPTQYKGGWLFVPESEFREPLAEVLHTVITHHRAAADPV